MADYNPETTSTSDTNLSRRKRRKDAPRGIPCSAESDSPGNEPVYASQGHRVSLKSALRLAGAPSDDFRIPRPTLRCRPLRGRNKAESATYGKIEGQKPQEIKTGGENRKGSTSRGGWGDCRKDPAKAVPWPECSSNPAFNRRCHVLIQVAQGKTGVNVNRLSQQAARPLPAEARP